MLNINGKQDSSYRYKMEPIKSKAFGKGNGIYTVITNIKEVAKYINHPPSLILKYFSFDLGSMCNEENNSITGGYDSNCLQESLQEYINRFVICPSCLVPETIPQLNKLTKKKIILEVKCSSCGKTSEINFNTKREEKMGDFIIKYLEKNEWPTCSKGLMVNQKSSSENLSSINLSQIDENEDEDENNPFD